MSHVSSTHASLEKSLPGKKQRLSKSQTEMKTLTERCDALRRDMGEIRGTVEDAKSSMQANRSRCELPSTHCAALCYSSSFLPSLPALFLPHPHSLTHSLSLSLIHTHTHTHSLTHSLTHSPTHPLTHPLTYSLPMSSFLCV